ncbi:rod shape-determining protein MreC [Neptunitalea lumnitzerae]|uniref:rod shape-determining protein MreC n=1 Tax=Neptunitalea lumnitzerae TaxID=2965509 RepID=UPI0024917863|nr:rod shape-determining protein MreC [Neptunitalea sp. Y10]
MRQIIIFIVRNKNFLLFLLLFCFSLGITIHSHIFHRSTFINSANFISGGVYGTVTNISDYFSLKTYNNRLIDENIRLREELLKNGISEIDSTVTSSTDSTTNYVLHRAEVYKNSYKAPKNYLLINKGSHQGIKEDMGVITSGGIIGIVENTSANYAVVQSVLNTNSQINASLKNTNHFGTLSWNEKKDYRKVQLTDIPKQANIKIGDTIITGGMSSIFPKGILVGTVEKFTFNQSGNAYIIDVKLNNDMTNVGYVYIIENKDKNEIEQLLETTENE